MPGNFKSLKLIFTGGLVFALVDIFSGAICLSQQHLKCILVAVRWKTVSRAVAIQQLSLKISL
jgi:hypothetical protein